MTTADTADLARVSLVSDEIAADPFPYFAQLVDQEPVFWNERQRAWLVSTYDEVTEAFRNEGIDADRIGPYVASRVPEEDRERFSRMFDILGRWLVFLSPPDHTRLRGLVHKSFTPRRVAVLQEKVEGIATGLARDLRARLEAGENSVDLMADYCVPLPGQVIAEMFGVPVEDGARLKGWAEELGLFINGALGDPQRNERVAVAMAEFERYLKALVERYRKEPEDNILSGLVAANDNDDTLNELELIATCMLILDAGYKTIQNATANAMLTLMQAPDAYERLAAHPELIKSAVEECLRYSGPGQIIVRRANRDLELGGQRIEKGSRVYLLTGAANRDPSKFEAPQEFRIDRAANPHLTFGQGIHFCLGASLARMEMAIGINTLLQELPRLELAVPPQDLKWHRVLILHGVESLPVRFAA
jgi:cytochrome P450